MRRFRFPVEAGQILQFARAVGEENPIYGTDGPEAAEALPLLIELSVAEREALRWDAVDAIRSVGNDAAAEELALRVACSVVAQGAGFRIRRIRPDVRSVQ